MREILFRGRGSQNGLWIYGDLVHRQSRVDGKITAGISDECGNLYSIEPDTVSQFTCLTDKRGRKIFENDIVKITDHTMEEFFEKCGEMVKQFLTRTFLVFWNDTKWSVKSLEPEFIPNPPVFDLPVENVTYEVIGNIHTR